MPEPWKSITGIEELEERAATAPPSVNPSPQFGRAVPQAATAIPLAATGVTQAPTGMQTQLPAGQRCQFCSSLFAGQYFLVGGQAACSNCAADAKLGQAKDNHTAYMASVLLGSGAAVVGLILYSGFTIVTHFYYGAFAVGWMIGAAMIFGSKGIGGLRYQVTGALLTYLAVAMSAVPIWLAEQSAYAGSAVDAARETSPLLLIPMGVVSPLFLLAANPIRGIIRLVVIFLAMGIAWKQTHARPLTVNGPYSIAG